jgi:hypothetical protein
MNNVNGVALHAALWYICQTFIEAITPPLLMKHIHFGATFDFWADNLARNGARIEGKQIYMWRNCELSMERWWIMQ